MEQIEAHLPKFLPHTHGTIYVMTQYTTIHHKVVFYQ